MKRDYYVPHFEKIKQLQKKHDNYKHDQCSYKIKAYYVNSPLQKRDQNVEGEELVWFDRKTKENKAFLLFKSTRKIEKGRELLIYYRCRTNDLISTWGFGGCE